MESLLIGSLHRPSIPIVAEFSPLKTSSHRIVRVLKCKAWKRPEKHFSTSFKLQKQYITQDHVGGSDLRSIAADKKLKERFLVHASSEHPLESQPSKSPWDSVHDAVDAFYRFSRPHTIIGTLTRDMTLDRRVQRMRIWVEGDRTLLLLQFLAYMLYTALVLLVMFLPAVIFSPFSYCFDLLEPKVFRKQPLYLEAVAVRPVYTLPSPSPTLLGIHWALSIISVSLLAVEKFSDFSPLFFTGVLEAIVTALFMNIYIVGLNQLSDIEIDKVNKPYLPLASGEYSMQTGVIVVSSFAVLSFWLGWIVGSWPLFWALFISFVLGTAYSINLPFLRWKRSAVVAAMCIFAVRAVIVQIAFYLHIQTYVYRRPAVLSRPLVFATAFMSFFSVVIALFKDIPDIVGDKIFGIQSFTVRLGQERVFWICIALLEMAYLVAIVVGLASSNTWSKYFTVLGHSALALLLWTRAKSVDLSKKAAITSFYMFIWKLFYAEYLLIPLVR